jgi:phosphatidylglycerol lysyltransferase
MPLLLRLVDRARRHSTSWALAATVTIAFLGFFALHRLLLEVRPADVLAAIKALSVRQIVAALFCTAVSYLVLTLYDVLALRIIGKPLPWRTAALASFTSYTLSHNLGLALVTGGSARYRVYTAAGLDPGDIARIIATASMAFWSGVLVLAGAALAIHPTAMAIGAYAVPLGLQRAGGLAMLTAIAALVTLAARPGRSISIGGWSLPLPSVRQALAQIAVAACDLAFAGAALFVLVPGASLSLLPTFVLAYAVAIVVAVVTHVPGGIGVFEAVLVACLPAANKPRLFAALIAYRIIYYLVPLALGALLLAWHEGRQWRQPIAKAVSGVQRITGGIAPTMLSALVFIGGVVLLVSGALPAIPLRMRALHAIVPLPFSEASHIAASLTGTVLLLLTPGLYRRLDGAFWLTRGLLLAGAGFSLLKGFDYEEALILTSICALLQWTKQSFYRRTRLTADILSKGWLATVAIAVGLSIWVGLFAYKSVSYQDQLWWELARRGDASRFLRASFAVAICLVIAAVWRLLRPPPQAAGLATIDPAIRDAALATTSRSDSFLALTGDKNLLASASGDAFLMYRVQGHSWIVMGDPVGPQNAWPELLWRLRDMADAAQGRVLLYQISQRALPIAIELGLQLVKYGEEARVDLSAFSLAGPRCKSMRHGERRAMRDGATFEIVAMADVPAIMPALRKVSQQWLAAKKQTEKGFSVGRFEPGYLSQFDCAVVRHEGQIVAFMNIWATRNHDELSVDLMRHADVLPCGTMDFLFVNLMRWGQANGYRWFNLGIAPLSGLEARRLSPFWARAGALLYRHGAAFYGFEGLRAYKEKFSPKWEPRYIAGPHGAPMARALMDLLALISPKDRTPEQRRPQLPARQVPIPTLPMPRLGLLGEHANDRALVLG